MSGLSKYANHLPECRKQNEIGMANLPLYGVPCTCGLEDALKEAEETSRLKEGHFQHLTEYMQAIESVLGFAGPVERVAEELNKLKQQLEEKEKAWQAMFDTNADNYKKYESLTALCNELSGALEGVEQLKELIEYPEGVQDDMLGESQAITQMFLEIRLALTKHQNALKR